MTLVGTNVERKYYTRRYQMERIPRAIYKGGQVEYE
jgi:hypothetical protein